VLAVKMPAVVTEPQLPEAVGNVSVAVFVAVVGLVPDTENVTATLE
jgi:hypothetical protein